MDEVYQLSKSDNPRNCGPETIETIMGSTMGGKTTNTNHPTFILLDVQRCRRQMKGTQHSLKFFFKTVDQKNNDSYDDVGTECIVQFVRSIPKQIRSS